MGAECGGSTFGVGAVEAGEGFSAGVGVVAERVVLVVAEISGDG